MTIDITFPTSWQELSQRQLLFVFRLLAMELSTYEVQTHALLSFGNLRLKECRGNGQYLFKHGNHEFVTDSLTVSALAARLDWLGELPSVPVRIEQVGDHLALPADFQGVEFERFIVCDNLFQGFIATREQELLQQMAVVMYDLPDNGKTLEAPLLLNVFYWFAALKQLFSAKFRHFLKPTGAVNSGNLLGSSMEAQLTEAMNAQIRALTKGDVTKERQVLSLDTWRALTELDALAREAEDFERKYKK